MTREEIMNTKVYAIETGILIPRNEKESEDYLAFDNEYGYYDECRWYDLEKLEKTKKWFYSIINDIVENTYIVVIDVGVVQSFNLEEDDIKDNLKDMEEKLNDFGEYSTPNNLRDIVWSAYKDENGVIHENFIKKS